MKFINLGYYNDIEDLKMLGNQTADGIVSAMLSEQGHFYKLDDKSPCDEIGVLDLNPQFTTDRKYAVVYDIPTNMSKLEEYKNKGADFFIDIYEVIEEDEDEFPTEKLCAKKAVSGQIVNMLINNIINDNGNETFEGWCEDGVVFEIAYPTATKEFCEECEKLMKKVAPLVDKLTFNFLAEH